MKIPLVLALFIELLREETRWVRIMRLDVSRARITTELEELLSLVRPTADVDAAAENVLSACLRL